MVGMTSRASAPLLALVALAAALRGSSDALLGGAGVAAAGGDLFRKGDDGDGDGGTERAGAKLLRDEAEGVQALTVIHGAAVEVLTEVKALLTKVESEVESKGALVKDKDEVKSKNAPDLRESAVKSMGAPLKDKEAYARARTGHAEAKLHAAYAHIALADEEADEHLPSEESVHQQLSLPPELTHEDPRVNESMEYLLNAHKDPAVSHFSCESIEHFHTVANATGHSGELVEKLNQGCMDGSIVDRKDIEKAQDELKKLRDPNIDHQYETVAQQICAKVNIPDMDIDLLSVREACKNIALDPDAVVDAAAALHQEAMPHEEQKDIEPTCQNITMFRQEIEASMLELAAATEQKHGRSLEDITELTGHKLGSEILEMFDCLCDKDNPTNRGCTQKVLRVVEDMGDALSQQADKDFAPGGKLENMMDMEALKKNLDRETRHLRASHSSTSTTGSQLETQHQSGRGCDPSGVVPTHNGYKVCIHAGTVLECEATVVSNPPEACASFSCGAGKILKLHASVKACPKGHWSSGRWHSEGIDLDFELKICLDVISDILAAIGSWIPYVESMMNDLNVYGGCYRIGTARYQTHFQRLEITVPEHKQRMIFNVYASVKGQAWFRFKEWGCNYEDGGKVWMGWYSREFWHRQLPTGDPWTETDWNTMCFQIMQPVYEWVLDEQQRKSHCVRHTGPWAQTSVAFKVYLDWGWFGHYTAYEYHNGWKT